MSVYKQGTEYSREDKRKEIARELALRRNVYPAMVRGKRLKLQEAERRIAILEAIERDYAGDGQ